MMFNKLASVSCALLFAGSVYAAPMTMCPNINEIKAEGIDMALPMMGDVYLSYHTSFYNTENNWLFAIGPIQAESDEEAIDIGNEVLEGMNASAIPEENGNDIVCIYETGDPDFVAVAVTNDSMISPSKLKHYIQKAR